MLKEIGRVVGSPFWWRNGRGRDGGEMENVQQRGYSRRRFEDWFSIPLVSGDDIDWSATSQSHEEYYASSTPVHAAVRVLAEAVSRPPLEVWMRRSPGAEPELAGAGHPMQQLLDRPNDVWDGGQLLRTIEGRLSLWGSAFVALSRDGDGVPYEMWPLRPREVRVVGDDDDRGVRGFVHETVEGRVAYLPEEMLWFRRFNPMRSLAGFSSMTPARAAVDMGSEAIQFNRRFYLHSAMPSDVVVTYGATFSDGAIDRLMDHWNQRLIDPDSAHKPIFLGEGMDMKRLGAKQSQSEFISALRWSVEEVSRAFGVPKVFLSEFEDATLANVRTMEQFLWRNTIIPELKMLEDGINHRLAPHFSEFPGELFVRFNLSDVEAVQESQSDRAERLSKLVGAGILSVEEARRELDV